ncbi:gamma-carboxymuconolactone decarboxylase protein [Hyaloraphidium curvatum]|nr:gamma-carboxymuconolactone decarboxylase protein [Hyaloraphidium curvatum]
MSESSSKHAPLDKRESYSAMTVDQVTRGLDVRRKVMGDIYVDRALGSVDEFNRPQQEIISGMAWGEIWTRPGLDLKTRSLLNLVMLSALNRITEFKGHVRGAINNGCTLTEIREALLQVTVYCGAPAGVEAFRSAQEVIAEMRKEGRELKF